MSDAEDQDLSTIEILLQKHKTEKKSLQAEIQAIKKAVPKGDKKREKIAKQKIAELENALKETQKQELEMVEKSQKTDASDSSTTVLDNIGEEPSETRQKPKGKAKRKQEKKAMKAKELADRLAQAEIDYEKSSRFKEEEEIKKILKDRGLTVKPIAPDGNCMYHAICDQLNSVVEITELRKRTATHMRSHATDFLPFLSTESGDPYTADEFESYCCEVEKSGVWGGQLELQAISNAFQTPIHVIQAGSSFVKLGEEYEQSPILLTYHRHELGLGEHYNSVMELVENKEEL